MNRTVRVEALSDLNAVMMIWEHEIHKGDTTAAFQHLMQYLAEAEQPLSVIVDLRQNPAFLIEETFAGALNGPFRHKMLKEWLVVGAGAVARGIGLGLSMIANRHNIRWYDTMEDVMAYLQKNLNGSA